MAGSDINEAPELTLAAPLERDAFGVIRVGGTRVRLDSIVDAFLGGATPEAIAAQFPDVTLSEVYAAVTFYLQQRGAVDAYLRSQARSAERNRAEVVDNADYQAWRERLLARIGGSATDAAAAG